MTDTEQSLCAEYEAWCAANKLPLMPADALSCELDYARDVTNDACKIDKITRQLQWLADFIKHWEKVTRGPGAPYRPRAEAALGYEPEGMMLLSPGAGYGSCCARPSPGRCGGRPS